MKGLLVGGLVTALAALPSAQAPAPPKGDQQKPTFSVQIDLVTNDVVVRDDKGQFVPDLTKDDFEVLEDGVRQDISSMTVVTGGRVSNVLAPPPPPPPEGVILPSRRPVSDTSGRVFVFFVDDLHMDFELTPRVRDLFKRISKNLLHDGDMWAMVSTGTSSIAIDLNYDRQRFDEAVKKITGNGMKPSEIIARNASAGQSEIQYRAHVAFSTVTDALEAIEKVHNRRKTFVYVSGGYDLAPFQRERLGLMDTDSPFRQNIMAQNENIERAMNSSDGGMDPMRQSQLNREEFLQGELFQDLAGVAASAGRANATIYTIDPRGLVGGPDIAENLDPSSWQNFVMTTQDSLRVLADLTGGIAVVNQNDFDKALKRIDAETSDYYVLGYYSNNPDPLRRRRAITVKVSRPGLTVWSRKEYVLRPASRPAPPKPETAKPQSGGAGGK